MTSRGRSSRLTRCSQCEDVACFQALSDREIRFCLAHWYVVGGRLQKKWRVVNRSAIESQKTSVEEAFREAMEAAASELAASAAARIMTVEEHDDPLAALVDDSKRRVDRHLPSPDPRPRTRRQLEQSKKVEPADPVCRRKRTKSTPMWSTAPKSPEGELPVHREDDHLPRGDPCPRCSSTATTIRPRGGGNVHAGKVETWGRKDAPDALYETTCLECNHIWQHED